MGGWGVRSREAPEDGVAGNTGGSVTGGGGARRASVAGAWNARALVDARRKAPTSLFPPKRNPREISGFGRRRARVGTPAAGDDGEGTGNKPTLARGPWPRCASACAARVLVPRRRAPPRALLRARGQKIGHATSRQHATRQNLNSRVSGSPNRVGLAEAVDGIRFSSHVWAV